MKFEIRYCPSCGMRRVAHRHLCSVCGSLVRAERPSSSSSPTEVMKLRPLVRAESEKRAA